MQTNQSNAVHSPQSKLAALAQQFGKDKNWLEAASRWQALTDLEPEHSEYWFNYGYSLNMWIAQSTDTQSIQAQAKRADAVWRKTIDLHKTTELQMTAAAYNNWGITLLFLAKTLTGEAQQQHFAEADQRYTEATRLKPDNADTYNNWGGALLAWAHTLQGDERTAKLDEAKRVLLRAKEKGLKDPYNLACISALQHRPDEAHTLLQETRVAGILPDHAHLSSDKDLDNLRELDWFKDLLAEVKQEEERQTAAV